MRHRTALLTLAVAALLVTAGCSQAVGNANPASAESMESDATRTIKVGASGRVDAQPNQAVVRVAVVATAADAQTARSRLAANVSRMRAALKTAGLDDEQIATAYYDISRDRRPPEKREVDDSPYRAVHSFRLTVTNLSRVGRVIDVAVNNGANRIDGVQFTITQEKRRQLRQRALTDAMKNARGQAEALAAASNLTVTGVYTIRTGRIDYDGYRVQTVAVAAGSAGTDIESGTITVSVQVQVTYNATAA